MSTLKMLIPTECRVHTSGPARTASMEQIRITLSLTGSIESEDLTPEARTDLTELYRRWRSG